MSDELHGVLHGLISDVWAARDAGLISTDEAWRLNAPLFDVAIELLEREIAELDQKRAERPQERL